MIRVAAPGKLVLLGEYAVLDGAPALVMAVDSGVVCTWHPHGAPGVETPGDDRFARAALEAVAAPSGRWVFEDWNPMPTATKVGIGGSAAATVAAVHAGLLARGIDDRAEAYRVSQRVHRAVQGSGSGVDIAAACVGGVLRFQAGRCEPVPAPRTVVVWSGQSARTGPRVAQYLALEDREGFVRDSTALVDAFATDPLRATRDGADLLGDMAARAGIAYWTPALRDICALASTCGGAAKPSGAGGGDCAVAVFRDDEQATAFRGCCDAAGHLVLPLTTAGPVARDTGPP